MTGLILQLNDFIYCKLLAHQSYGETVEYIISVQFNLKTQHVSATHV